MKLKLNKSAFYPLRIKEIQPQGWLLNQLKIQAEGLSGNLDKFWPDIKNSRWIGGTADGWERVPYWLDGFIPLAWLLNDSDMKSRATKYINYIIESQKEDGWISPDNNSNRYSYDMWAFILILKVLTVYYNATEDDRIEAVISKALKAFDRHIDTSPLFNWGQFRWFECLIPIFWLYERTGEDWLINLVSKIRSQGFDWQSFFKLWPYTVPDEKGRWSYMSHVVNNAMMLKSGPLLWRLTGSEDDLQSAEYMVSLLDKYHGMVTGVFSGDECLNGTSPVQGTELCAVAEYMYSLEHLISITGKPHWGDRLERIAYNALPATFSPDMWTHQYDQQVNQVECSIQEHSIFSTNSGSSHIFGLEPNFGCCTANLSQPWPKFALSTFMRNEDGLAAVAYAPCTINTCIKGVNVTLELNTGYPFRQELNFKVRTDQKVNFAIYLRIPQWADNAVISISNREINPGAGEFYELRQDWDGENTFKPHLPMKPELVSRSNNLYAIIRGPLVYSLSPGERWVRINNEKPYHEYPCYDYEIYPTTPWNYGLYLDPEKIEEEIEFKETPIGDLPFSPSGAPIFTLVRGKKIDWKMENKSAAPIPGMEWIEDTEETLKLIPYGCTNLRITEMPILKHE
jgi:hypothetical protein